MKARIVVLAIVSALFWLIPGGVVAQGNSGKNKITICHIPPGNPDKQRTMTVPEPAWRGHESHGDVLGSCERYGDDYGDYEDDG
ncbi:unnamed protein product, partial [marine sediment metagenome]